MPLPRAFREALPIRVFMKLHEVTKKTFISWYAHDPFTQSAAAAYFALFSMPGLLIIIMAIAALFFEPQQVEAEVLGNIRDVIGENATRALVKIIEQTQTDNRGFWAMLVGGATLLWGAARLFVQLQRSLNNIWEMRVKKTARIVTFLKTRATAFGVILMIGFLLLVSLAITALLTLLGDWLAAHFSPALLTTVQIINAGISYLIIAVLFALIFKILPDAKVKWRSAFYGGIFSALLFTIGEHALTYYFKAAEPQSAFGAAGSIILLMMWVSYSCLILLLGAEFAKVYGEEKEGRKAETTEISERIDY